MEKSRGTDYIFGYYNGMNPNRARFTLANRGIAIPKIETACELGFGQGVSIAINSAASDCSWYGTDIEPSHVSFTRELISHCEEKCQVFDESFQEFKNNPALVQFDFICLHGIWTWVTDADRKNICEFIDKKLRPGGLLYISYNALPAWSNFLPIQKLFSTYCEHNKSINSDDQTNLTDSFRFAQKLMETKPKFLKVNPGIKTALEKIQNRDPKYLVHEYLAADFTPMTFDTISQWLKPLNMSYVCSSEFLHDMPGINVTQEQQKFLLEIKNVVFRETCRDLMVNKDFRQDYWVKGASPLSDYQREKELDEFSLLLTSNINDIKFEVEGAARKAALNEEIYKPVLEFLRDHEQKNYREIIDEMEKTGIEEAKAAQAVEILFCMGHLSVITGGTSSKANKEDVKALNNKIINKTYNNVDIEWLASSVIEGGVTVGKINKIHLQSFKLGCDNAEQYAESGWEILRSMKQKIIKDKVLLKSEKENLQYLKEHAEDFLTKAVPIFRALEILD